MARKKKNNLVDTTKEDNFVPRLYEPGKPDLSNTTTGLTDALTGFEEPSPIETPSLDEPVLDLSISADSTGKKPRRPYTKRKKATEDELIDLIDGEDIQMFMDLVIPMAIAGIHNMTSKEKMSPDNLMLTPKQEEKMNRLCQRVADKIKLSMNPFVALGIGGFLAYGGNYMKNKP